ncbi:hypothetical protein [Virgibacillus byunsanensis]|uniref:hypothetical protein n=1 Tax=Virgibacillus byunsanensis TaxID=570945 RepID=UPI0036F2462F
MKNIWCQSPITALKRAMVTQPPTKGSIHHSDRGSQYASNDYLIFSSDLEALIH